jgi:hypothetical protein
MFLAGLNPPNRPVGNLLFLGPTGSGKTRTVEAAAQTLFGDPRACLKVDCAEFQHSHEIAKLIGCFAKGTRVLMHDGSVKPIEKIKVGDKVITKTGEPQTVTFLHKYKYDGPMTVLNIANSNIPVVCTPQHQILAIRTGINGGRPTTHAGRDVKARYNPDKLDWVAASELKKGDIVVYPRQQFTWAEETKVMGVAASAGNAHVDDKYIYNQIKYCTTTTNLDEFVYDFSVPGNTSYVVENSTIVSNSPPGYLGHRETHPMITQEALNQWHTPDLPLSLLLFDEIEKSSDSLWQLLLGILDKATLTLGDNRRVDLSSCIIVLTSNLGAADIMKLQEGGGLGFQPKSPVICDNFDKKIYDSAMSAAKKKFTPEFMNRIDKTVVFNTLRPEHLEEILEIELRDVQFRISVGVGGQQFAFKCLPNAKAALLIEGTDPKYGARHLKRAIERNLVFPLANLVATKQLKMGDSLDINYDGKYPNGHYTFTKTAEEIYTTSKAAASGSPSTQKIY